MRILPDHPGGFFSFLLSDENFKASTAVALSVCSSFFFFPFPSLFFLFCNFSERLEKCQFSIISQRRRRCGGFRFGCHGSHCPRRLENMILRDVGWQVHFKSYCIFSLLINKQTEISRVTQMRELSLRIQRFFFFFVGQRQNYWVISTPATDISGDLGDSLSFSPFFSS